MTSNIGADLIKGGAGSASRSATTTVSYEKMKERS
jgi:hypothetical protein